MPNPVTISVPKDLADGIVRMTSEMTGRMHELLERNTDGPLPTSEKDELASLVRVAQFGQIVAMAIGRQGKP